MEKYYDVCTLIKIECIRKEVEGLLKGFVYQHEYFPTIFKKKEVY